MPLVIYPAVTVGVTLSVALAVAVMRPVEELTLIDGLAVIVVAGVVAEPIAIYSNFNCAELTFKLVAVIVLFPSTNVNG